MPRFFPQPTVLVSRCLGFGACRDDGQQLQVPIIDLLKTHARFVDICPEMDAGLGVPRDPIRLCISGDRIEAWQPAKSRPVTAQLKRASADILCHFKGCDGAILKSKSPSCGLYDATVFRGKNTQQLLRWGSGILGESILAEAGNKAVDDESRLSDKDIREHFLIRLYASARFREIAAAKQIKGLIAFHASYKFLFLAYNEKRFRTCGKIVANHDNLPCEAVFQRYRLEMALLLKRPFCRNAMVNALYHAYGLLTEGLSAEEKKDIITTIEAYRDERISLRGVTRLLEKYAVRFGKTYVWNQALLQPFPEKLSLFTDAGNKKKGT
ncbi:MAG: hypothetical protein CSA22_09800 [Deltaproteobacteria bacterium]|nr:MAG: hypothetical protein CSA22_09800 [Deltaproteobacteria bacterium]